jgi:Mg-chelatase subunit ChlD
MKGEWLEALKQAAIGCFDALGSDDQLAVVTVDQDAQLLVPLQPSTNGSVHRMMSHLEVGSATNVVPGLNMTFELLRDAKLQRKHVIIVADGGSPSDGLPNLMKAMRDAHISMSVVGVHGAELGPLSTLAGPGGGRLYLVDEASAVPKIVAKETNIARGASQ